MKQASASIKKVPRQQIRQLLLLKIFLLIHSITIFPTAKALTSPSSNIRIRRGKPSDIPSISFTMARELMNPLGISHNNNLLVACDVNNSQKLIGWAQIRSIGYADGATSNTLFNNVGNRMSIEQEVDELLWEEFEEDPTPIPNGLASLPWTEEYKAASLAADTRLARRRELLQREMRETPKLWELSSVYVLPEYRNCGVGSELVRRVINQQRWDDDELGRDLYALTLAKNVEWYRQFGFEVEEGRVPEGMGFEVGVGNFVTKLIGEELACMKMQLW